MRVVNRRFKTVAEHVLNTSFKDLEKQISLIKNESAFYTNDASLDSREMRSRCKLLNVIEILMLYVSCVIKKVVHIKIRFQYELTMTTIWRYVYVPRSTLCMYAGEILDNYVIFMRKYYKSPKSLCIPSKPKDYVIVVAFDT